MKDKSLFNLSIKEQIQHQIDKAYKAGYAKGQAITVFVKLNPSVNHITHKIIEL